MDEQRLRALASAASVGPWSVQGNNLDEWYVYALHARYETLPGNPTTNGAAALRYRRAISVSVAQAPRKT